MTAIGDASGVILPEEVLARFKVREGDERTLIETPDGYELTIWEPGFARCMDAGRKVAREYREVLRALAKS